jgi:hypothetical protein
MNSMIYKNKKPLLVFLIPAFAFLIVFLYYPFFQNVVNTFLKIGGLGRAPEGLNTPWYENYQRLFTDPYMHTALKNTLLLTLCTIVFQVGIALILALLVDTIRVGTQFFRTVYFFPIVISATALGLMFNLIFLYKGGRCSATAAVAATALNIKPSINVIGGKMDVGKKYRGSYEKCLMKYIRDRLEGADDIDPRRLFITRSTENADIDKKVLEEVSKYVQFEEVNYTRAGCTVCGHCGPDTLGILYMHKRK